MTNFEANPLSCSATTSLRRDVVLTVVLALLVTGAWFLGVHPVLGGALTGAVVGGATPRLVLGVRATRRAAAATP